MMFGCPIENEHAESVIRSIGASSIIAVGWFNLPCRVVITGEKCLCHRLDAAPVTELAHQVCNLGPSENVMCRPHFVKPGEHSRSLMQTFTKTLKERHFIQ